MVSCCCSSLDRLLTKTLIEICDCPSNNFRHFSNRSEWIDGLDYWSLEENIFKSDFCQNSLYFHEDLRLYFPRDEQVILSPIDLISSKVCRIVDHLPKRLQNLIDQQKDFYFENVNCSIGGQCSLKCEDI
ncbi:hypothetical protein DMUE_6437, partial [Dictyocoela muelleri]